MDHQPSGLAVKPDEPRPLGKPQKLRTASAALLVIGVTSLALGFVAIAEVAAHFGAGPDTDVLFLSQLLPVMLGLHSRSVLHLCLVPKFVATRTQRGQDEAWSLATSFANLALLTLGTLALGYGAAAPLAARWMPGLTPENASRFVHVTRIVTPVIVLYPMFALSEALLYSYQRYTTTALATLLPSLGLIGGVVLLAPSLGIEGAAWGLVLGYAAQAMAVIPLLAPYHRHLRLRIDWGSAELRAVLRQVAPTVTFSLTVVAGFAIAAVLASRLGPGRVAAFRYGTSVLAVLPTLVQGSVVSPLYPRMSAFAAEGDTDKLRQLVVSFVRIASVVVMPITALVIVLREPMVAALFVRGRFTADGAHLTSQVVLGFAPWIAAIVLNQVPTYLAMSLGEARRVATLVVMLLLPMTLLGFVLSKVFDVGGIAVTFSINAWVSLPLLILILRRRMGRLGMVALGRAAYRPLLAAFIMAICIAPAERWSSHLLAERAALAGFGVGAMSLARLCQTALLGMLGVALYLPVARVLRVPEIASMMEWIRGIPVPPPGPMPAADATGSIKPTELDGEREADDTPESALVPSKP